MAASLVGLGLLCAGGASAQEASRPLPSFAYGAAATTALPSVPPPGQSGSTAATPRTTSPFSSTFNASPLPATRQMLDFHKDANSTAGMPAMTAPRPVNPSGLSLQRVALQPLGRDLAPAPDETLLEEDLVQLEPPGPHRLFGRLDSEDSLQERLRQQARQRSTPERITFPDEPVVSRETYADRRWEPQELFAEPNYVCYGRLYFEQKNFERYGWDLYLLSPFLSAGAFFFDVAALPYHCATEPFRKCECSAGYCLPGDPVPLLLYPPELSLTGALAEAATVVGLAAIFP